MALDADKRRVLRSFQLCLESSVPTKLLGNLGRHDVDGWCALAMREVRMLLARGQTYQARQFASRLPAAVDAGLPVQAPRPRELALLLAGVNSVLGGWHWLALRQLMDLTRSASAVICWGALLWQSRAQIGLADLRGAEESVDAALEVAARLGAEAPSWTACFRGRVQGRLGETRHAESSVLQALSAFVDEEEARGQSFAYVTLADLAWQAGRSEDCDAAAEIAHRTDGSWTAPALLLARTALASGNLDRADQLLGSIPSATIDASYLTQMVRLARRGQVPVEAILMQQELAARPVGEDLIRRLSDLVELFPLPQLRTSLFWNLLASGCLHEAERELGVMVHSGIDGESIAAARFSLQAAFEEIELLEDQELCEEVTDAEREDPTIDRHPLKPLRPTTTGELLADPLGSGLVKGRTGAFTGQLSLFGVPDLLQFLCASRRTGDLTFSCQQGDSHIQLFEGSLHCATSPKHPRVIDFLVESGVVPTSVTVAADVRDLGQVVEQHQLDLAKIAAGLREIVKATLKEVVEWSDGWFMFDRLDDARPPPPELLFSAQGMLLDALRELDEERR